MSKREHICKNCRYYVYNSAAKGLCDNEDISVRWVYPHSRCVFWENRFHKPWYLKLMQRIRLYLRRIKR